MYHDILPNEVDDWTRNGAVLVEEAGGVITDMDGGTNYLSSGNVVCGPSGVHRELLEVVGTHRDAWKENLDR